MRFSQLGQIWQRGGAAGKHQVINITDRATRRVKELQKTTDLLSRCLFKRFKHLGLIVIKGFYAELPISLEVSGSYHQLATFISGIAALPRIVTINDMKLEPFDKEDLNGKLKMAATAKTYRYLQEDEQ